MATRVTGYTPRGLSDKVRSGLSTAEILNAVRSPERVDDVVVYKIYHRGRVSVTLDPAGLVLRCSAAVRSPKPAGDATSN